MPLGTKIEIFIFISKSFQSDYSKEIKNRGTYMITTSLLVHCSGVTIKLLYLTLLSEYIRQIVLFGRLSLKSTSHSLGQAGNRYILSIRLLHQHFLNAYHSRASPVMVWNPVVTWSPERWDNGVDESVNFLRVMALASAGKSHAGTEDSILMPADIAALILVVQAILPRVNGDI
jgi:hypothetical protein